MTKKFELVDGNISKLEGELKDCEQSIHIVESDLKKIKSLEQQLILETATVKPREVFGSSPTNCRSSIWKVIYHVVFATCSLSIEQLSYSAARACFILTACGPSSLLEATLVQGVVVKALLVGCVNGGFQCLSTNLTM